MKHKTRKALSWLLTLSLVLGLFPALGTTARAEDTKTLVSFTLAGQDGDAVREGTVTWSDGSTETITFNSANSLPTAGGSYYLTNNVTLSTKWSVPTGATVNLCLNGHSITYTGSSNNFIMGVYNSNGTATLNLYDCDTAEHKYTITDGLATVNDSATGEGVKTFTGGYITGGKQGGVCVRRLV